jgi:hypothetical protein
MLRAKTQPLSTLVCHLGHLKKNGEYMNFLMYYVGTKLVRTNSLNVYYDFDDNKVLNIQFVLLKIVLEPMITR